MKKILSTVCLSALTVLATNSFATESKTSYERYATIGLGSENIMDDKSVNISGGILKEVYGPLSLGAELRGSISAGVIPGIEEGDKSKRFGGSTMLKARLNVHSKLFLDAGVGYGISSYYNKDASNSHLQHGLASFGAGYRFNEKTSISLNYGFNFANSKLGSTSSENLDGKNYQSKLGLSFGYSF